MKHIFLIIILSLTGCASVSEDWQRNKETGEMELQSRLTCRGTGCKSDHEKRTMEGGTFLPPVPIKVDN